MDSELKSILEKIDRMDRKLTALLTEKKKPSWVRASVITKLTGWNYEKMRQARANGYIEFKSENGLWYNINSLNDIFLIESHKQKSTTN